MSGRLARYLGFALFFEALMQAPSRTLSRRSRAARLCLVWGQYLLFVAGFSALGYCALVTGTARLYQARAREQLSKSNVEVADLSTPARLLWPSPEPLRAGSGLPLLGRVDVPRIGLSAMVAEGAGSHVLRMAIGHVPGTAFPWQSGNVGLAAHRDTFFRRLGELRPGDAIRITVPGAEYDYHVSFTGVVKPGETWIMQPASGKTLTLVTCYPFYYVGPAPNRFVVRARLDAK
jgi:sortase A